MKLATVVLSHAMCAVSAGAAFAAVHPSTAPCQALNDITWSVRIAEQVSMVRKDITYRTVNNYPITLDVYVQEGGEKSRPTLLFLHGGGWLGSANKDNALPLFFLPFLHFGWNVVNADYRPSSVSLAPAAVDDVLCALRWVGENFAKYKIDPKQIVAMGTSAGALLALTTGMIPLGSAGLGSACGNVLDTQSSGVKLAAMVSWVGVTDVSDLLAGDHQEDFAVTWVGSGPDRARVAAQVSPINHVRAGLPPIISIHGDSDSVVPYSQAVRFHDALTKAQVTNKLIGIPGGGHWGFGLSATRDAYVEVFTFLKEAGVTIDAR